MIESIVKRLSLVQLVNLLPVWQRPYFSSENIDINKESLQEYIIESINELIEDNKFLVSIIDCLDAKEYFEIMVQETFTKPYLNEKRKFKQDIILNKLQPRVLNHIKRSIGLTEIEKQEKNQSIDLISVLQPRFYELLDYQMYIKEQILSIIDADYLLPRVLIHMPTGTGKTKTTMHTVAYYYTEYLKNNGLIIWVAHTNILLEQAISTLENIWMHLGNKPLRIYKLFGGEKAEEIGEESASGILFCNISSLINLSKANTDGFELIAKKVNMIVFDEAHKILAIETSRVINQLMRKKDGYTNKALLGLTATPGRNIFDNEDNERLAEYFERRILSIDIDTIDKFTKNDIFYANLSEKDSRIIRYFQNRKILSRLKREVIDYRFNDKFENELRLNINKNIKDDYTNIILKLFSLNVNRNEAIIKRLVELDYENIPTIFFACSVEHGKLIGAILKAKGVRNSQVYADTDIQKRIKEIDDFKKGRSNILINVSVLTTGFDSTNIKCVFISRPTKSIVLYSQMIGRGLRGPRMGGNEECLLIDMKDNLERFSDENEAFEYFEEYWR